MEHAVAGIAEAGADVAALVEFAVERGDVDVHIRVGRGEAQHAIGRGDQADVADPVGPDLLHQVHRADCRAAGRQHRVDDEAAPRLPAAHRAVVVRHRAQRRLVAVEAEVPDARVRQQAQQRFDHRQPRPQDRDDHHVLRQLVPGRRLQRRRDRALGQRQVGQRLVAEQPGDLRQQLAEARRTGPRLAQQRQLRRDQRVPRDVQPRVPQRLLPRRLRPPGHRPRSRPFHPAILRDPPRHTPCPTPPAGVQYTSRRERGERPQSPGPGEHAIQRVELLFLLCYSAGERKP